MPKPAQAITAFAITPTSITAGGSATLTWATARASSVLLNGVRVALSGSQNVKPATTMDYRLEVDGSKPRVRRIVTLDVKPVVVPPPIPTPTPTPIPPPQPAAAPALFDGRSGVTGAMFNVGAGLPWENVGGDWRDAAGGAQGAIGYGRLTLPAAGQAGVDITVLANRWLAAGNTGAVLYPVSGSALVATRRHANVALRPALVLTYADGSVRVCECTASAAADRTSVMGSAGTQASVGPGTPLCLAFDIGTRAATKAVLSLTSLQYGPTVFDVMELRAPRIFAGGVAQLGLAEKYPLDVGLGADPAVIVATNLVQPTPFGGTYPADAVQGVDTELGVSAVEMKYHVNEFSPYDGNLRFAKGPVEQRPDDCPSELFFRYYLKLRPNYQCADQGKKLPGIAGRFGYWNPTPKTYQNVDGNGGSATRGVYIAGTDPDSGVAVPTPYYSGWSMRHLALEGPSNGAGVAERDNPLFALVSANTYAYTAGMPQSKGEGYGEMWRWGNAGVGWVLYAPDRWYSIEQYVKVNSVVGPFDGLGNGTGQRDGIFRAWVDGVLVVERTDVLYRHHPAIKIDEAWLCHYHGGKTPAEAEHGFAMAAVAVARAYIGPMKRGTAPPPETTTMPAIPINVAASVSGQAQTVSFNADAATSWDVQRAPDVAGAPGTWSDVGNITTSPFGDPTPLADGWYRMRGRNAAGVSAWSAPVKGHVDAPAPPPPPPPVGTWPFTLPASGAIGPIGANTMQSVGAADGTEAFYLRKVLGAWGGAAVSLVKNAQGQVVDIVYWIIGGGHNDTGWDGVILWRASTGRFELALPPSHHKDNDGNWAWTNVVDVVHGEDLPNRPGSQHVYQNVWGLDSDETNGPALIQAYGSGVGGAGISCGQAHRFPLATKVWERFCTLPPAVSGNTHAWLKDFSRKRLVRYPSNNGNTFAMIDYLIPGGVGSVITGSQRDFAAWNDSYEATGVYDPVRDLYIVGMLKQLGQLAAVDGGAPGLPFAILNQTGTLPPSTWGVGLQYRAVADEFLMVTVNSGVPQCFALKPPPAGPNQLTAPWVWSKRDFTGSSQYVGVPDHFNRWQYVAALDAMIVCPAIDKPMECWKL